ncbi:hypothetical protein [Sphingomonas sp.]|jgi:hypothetical protein|nr:hypothetical protein [Sphingomonas sp.]
MNFTKWRNALDALRYEVMSRLLFFPLTLWAEQQQRQRRRTEAR